MSNFLNKKNHFSLCSVLHEDLMMQEADFFAVSGEKDS